MLIACALLGAEAGLTKTVPDHQVQIQDSGLSRETLEPDKTGQGVFFFFSLSVTPRTVPTRVIMQAVTGIYWIGAPRWLMNDQIKLSQWIKSNKKGLTEKNASCYVNFNSIVLWTRFRNDYSLKGTFLSRCLTFFFFFCFLLVACWDLGLNEWRSNILASGNPQEASESYLGGDWKREQFRQITFHDH